MRTRKRWIVVAVALVLVCALLGGVGGALLVSKVPAVARLVFGDPPTPTARGTLRPTFTPFFATVTPTPTPTGKAATPTPAAPPTAASGEPAGKKATATVPPTLESPTPTSSPPSPTPTPPPPSPTPRPEWIAFETVRGSLGDYEIFVMKPDGSQQTNVTNSWADDVAPVWSPDGQHIAFVSLRDTLTGKWGLGDGSIYVLDFDPLTGEGVGQARRVTDGSGADGWPTWSPDGQRIAFHSDRSGDWEIWAINLDGSALVNLTNKPGDDRYPAWSPDGKRITFTSKRSGNQDIWVMNANGSNPVNLTKSPGRDRYAMWSPDGKQFTFNTNRDGNYEVYLMNADGSNQRNVSQAPDSTEGLADWSPDGKRLVLYSDRLDHKEIFVLDLATGLWTNISNHPASDEFCTWSP